MQKELLAVIRGEDIDIEAFQASLSADTRSHCDAVAQLAETLLRWAIKELPLEFGDCSPPEEVGRAARYHDIGMILIPDRVLNKSGDLTAAEHRVIRQHATYGGTLLDNYRKRHEADPVQNHFWRIAAEIALGHHEQWDGKGYPYGELATAVPAYVRAVTVADAYDSMVRGSSYRMPLPPEYALVEIIHHSGRQFDPWLTEVFREHFTEVL